MNRYWLLLLAIFGLSAHSLAAAPHTPPDTVLKETYINKFGNSTSKDDWEERGQTGKIVSTQFNGVKVTREYYQGVLQGKVSYTYPKSDVIEKTEVYENGVPVSTIYHYPNGHHYQELAPISPILIQITTWFENGAPKSIEEMDGRLIYNAIYYNPDHEEDSRVVEGEGIRTNRSNQGKFLSKDTIQNGVIVLKTTYHSSGAVGSVTTYDNDVMHGTKRIFDVMGQPVEIQAWERGFQHGVTKKLSNGQVIAEIPYYYGNKHGVERHYDEDASPLSEISWMNGAKHGATRVYSDEGQQVQWFMMGRQISNPKKVSREIPEPYAPKKLPNSYSK